MKEIEFVHRICKEYKQKQVNNDEDINWSLFDFNKKFKVKNHYIDTTSNQAEPQVT